MSTKLSLSDYSIAFYFSLGTSFLILLSLKIMIDYLPIPTLIFSPLINITILLTFINSIYWSTSILNDLRKAPVC